MAVQRQVGGVQVQHDALGRLGVGFYKEADQQLIDGLLPIVNLLVATRLLHAQLQPVQRAFARQGLLAAEHTQQRVVAQLVMVGEIFVAQRQRVYALRNQLRYGVGDQPRLAPIVKASRQTRQQVQPPVRLAQQQGSGIGGHGATVEAGHHLA